MKPGPREIAFAVLLLAVPLGAWHFLFRPQNRQDAELRRQIEAKQERLRAVNQATAAIGDLQKEIASLTGAIDFFQSKLPSDKEIDQVLQDLWEIAGANQLTTKSVRPLPRAPENLLAGGAQHAEQPISMQLEGDFQGFYGFLQALESRPRIMRIRNLTMGRSARGDGQITANLVLSIFFDKGSAGSRG
jgi:type IV pilus assembly protein PilO